MLHFENTSLIDLDGENWASAYGFDGFYEVSNKGRVKSLKRKVYRKDGKYHTVPTRIMRQCKIKHKYDPDKFSLYVRLAAIENGNQQQTKCYKNVTVASLVLNSFKKPDVFNDSTHHVNGCPYDNNLENLAFEDLSTKMKIDYDAGVRNGHKCTAHLRSQRDKAIKNFDKIRINPNNLGKKFEKRNKKSITVYLRSNSFIGTYTCVKNASEQLGIKEYILRNALYKPNKHKYLQVKFGSHNLQEFSPR